MIDTTEFCALLVSEGILTRDASAQLQKKFIDNYMSMAEHLLKSAAVKKEILGNILGGMLGVAYVDLDKTLFQSYLVSKLPREIAIRNLVIPLYQLGDKITAATASPSDLRLLSEAEQILGMPISPVLSFPGDIIDSIEIQYQSSDSLEQTVHGIDSEEWLADETEIMPEQLENLASDQTIVEVTRNLMLFGVKERASDIHFEPHEKEVYIRFRIDGVLHEKIKLARPLLLPLISRLKILAELDITERRKPQDGRITLELSNRSIDFRLSSVPTIYGEKMVLRILGQVHMQEAPDLHELNFSKSYLDGLKKAARTPYGCFFITGPTGSGKTTTLFSILKYVNSPEINIMTIEDPVEYTLTGTNQIQVNNTVGLNFANALRAFLRQDPDVILIGEIRDLETARIATQAALTGHLVLASMHTNNAPQALTRLTDIGVEPFLVAPSIIGVMSQRLVRRICFHCKTRYALSADEIERYFVNHDNRRVYFYKGKGCPECNYTGYSGRLAIHEILMVNEQIRKLINHGASNVEIEEAARDNGFRTMRYDGMKKVLRGITTIEELERVIVLEA